MSPAMPTPVNDTENVPPAPVTMMTRTASSAIAPSIASASTTRSSRSIAFRVPGRFKVSTRTRS
jgi:hypothetical protein